MRAGTLVLLALLGLTAPAAAIDIAAMGHLYIGGQQVVLKDVPPRARFRGPSLPPAQVEPNGVFTAGATYVSFVTLAHPRHRFPILMMPGGGLSGAIYETTPDGRPGWQWFFLRAGYSTYVADLDQTGRSSFARYPEIDPDEPAFRANDFLWEVFRIGRPGSFAAGPVAYPGTQFPVAAFQTFAKQAQPRFRIAPEAEAAVYDEMLPKICPCILLTHSASGAAGLAAVTRWPKLIKAVISVEPSDAPPTLPDAGAPPHLFVWGDFLGPKDTDPDWAHELKIAQDYRAGLLAHGIRANEIMLPALGIRGNSHLPMADRNSDQVAALIARWLHRQGL